MRKISTLTLSALYLVVTTAPSFAGGVAYPNARVEKNEGVVTKIPAPENISDEAGSISLTAETLMYQGRAAFIPLSKNKSCDLYNGTLIWQGNFYSLNLNGPNGKWSIKRVKELDEIGILDELLAGFRFSRSAFKGRWPTDVLQYLVGRHAEPDAQMATSLTEAVRDLSYGKSRVLENIDVPSFAKNLAENKIPGSFFLDIESTPKLIATVAGVLTTTLTFGVTCAELLTTH